MLKMAIDAADTLIVNSIYHWTRAYLQRNR